MFLEMYEQNATNMYIDVKRRLVACDITLRTGFSFCHLLLFYARGCFSREDRIWLSIDSSSNVVIKQWMRDLVLMESAQDHVKGS